MSDPPVLATKSCTQIQSDARDSSLSPAISFPIMDLPLELRQMCYGFAIEDSAFLDIPVGVENRIPRRIPALCKAIPEALPIWISKVTLSVDDPRFIKHLFNLLESVDGELGFNSMRNLQFDLN